MWRGLKAAGVRLRLALCAIMVSLAGSAWMVTTLGTAQATTGGVNYPQPNVSVPAEVQSPVLGRYFIREVARAAHIRSGQLDIEDTELYPTFLVGEISLYSYVDGRPTTTLVDLYPWEASGDKLSAHVILPFSINAEAPEGQRIGELTVTVPRRDWGVGNNATEAKTLSGQLTLNGRGPYAITFIHGSDDRPPPEPLPSAKQTGRR